MFVSVTIEGLTPLLMNRFPDTDTSAPKAAMRGGEKGTPREQAEPKTYRLPDGELYIPGPNIYASIIEAGKFHKVGKRQLTTMKTSFVPCGVSILEPECGLHTCDYEVDSRPVVIPSTGGKVMCHRPRLDKWRTNFTLDIDTTEFEESLVRHLVDDAGKKLGLGDFRPQRKGPFGRFVVTMWERVK